MDRESLGSTKHFDTKSENFQAKVHVSRRFKTSSVWLSPVQQGALSLLVLGIALLVDVHAIPIIHRYPDEFRINTRL